MGIKGEIKTGIKWEIKMGIKNRSKVRNPNINTNRKKINVKNRNEKLWNYIDE